MRERRSWITALRASMQATVWSIRARQSADGELDAIPGQHAPSLDLGLIGGLGEAAEQLARHRARLFARQRESFAPERIRARAGAVGDELGGPPRDIGGTKSMTHDTPKNRHTSSRNLPAHAARGESRADSAAGE